MAARALYFTGERSVEVRREPVEEPGAGELAVETLASGISAGTELLVYRDETPDGMAVDETITSLDGTFDYPLRYGYAAVGEVRAAGEDVDDEWLGRRVFAFEPHASRFRVPADAVVRVPADVDTATATLLPTLETATNFVMDARPRVGERVVVFGAGAIGLATTHVLAGFPLAELVVVEPNADRREHARAFGADDAVPPEAATGLFADADPPGADLAVEVSGAPSTLDAAIDAVGYDGRIVVGSWYGTKRAPVDLGGSFHRDRISVESSQVSTVAPAQRGRWTKGRRLGVAFDGLRRIDADRLISPRVPFADAREAYRLLDRGAEGALHVVLDYR
jgi:2-desacetyl-2-hydroxyethyl bacteriochlorophyllide A dehydrogenase